MVAVPVLAGTAAPVRTGAQQPPMAGPAETAVTPARWGLVVREAAPAAAPGLPAWLETPVPQRNPVVMAVTVAMAMTPPRT